MPLFLLTISSETEDQRVLMHSYNKELLEIQNILHGSNDREECIKFLVHFFNEKNGQFNSLLSKSKVYLTENFVEKHGDALRKNADLWVLSNAELVEIAKKIINLQNNYAALLANKPEVTEVISKELARICSVLEQRVHHISLSHLLQQEQLALQSLHVAEKSRHFFIQLLSGIWSSIWNTISSVWKNDVTKRTEKNVRLLEDGAFCEQYKTIIAEIPCNNITDEIHEIISQIKQIYPVLQTDLSRTETCDSSEHFVLLNTESTENIEADASIVYIDEKPSPENLWKSLSEAMKNLDDLDPSIKKCLEAYIIFFQQSLILYQSDTKRQNLVNQRARIRNIWASQDMHEINKVAMPLVLEVASYQNDCRIRGKLLEKLYTEVFFSRYAGMRYAGTSTPDILELHNQFVRVENVDNMPPTLVHFWNAAITAERMEMAASLFQRLNDLKQDKRAQLLFEDFCSCPDAKFPDDPLYHMLKEFKEFNEGSNIHLSEACCKFLNKGPKEDLTKDWIKKANDFIIKYGSVKTKNALQILWKNPNPKHVDLKIPIDDGTLVCAGDGFTSLVLLDPISPLNQSDREWDNKLENWLQNNSDMLKSFGLAEDMSCSRTAGVDDTENFEILHVSESIPPSFSSFMMITDDNRPEVVQEAVRCEPPIFASLHTFFSLVESTGENNTQSKPTFQHQQPSTEEEYSMLVQSNFFVC